MSATFASPVAAVLLAVELLLFEWKPRSLIPVALASAVAAVARRYILGFGPLFPVPAHPLFIGPKGLLGCALVGLLAGALSALLTLSVYAAEDAFQKLPVHWMWWPAIGGAAIGLGGLIFPQALGVGYDTIGALLGGTMRSPFTSIIFAFELTHDTNVFLPLLVGSVIAHAFTVLTLKRSILTEKVARRGYHLSREYAVDPLEILFVREVMRANIVVLPAARALGEFQHSVHASRHQSQRLLPVVSADGRFIGVLTRGDIVQRIEQEGEAAQRRTLGELVRKETVEAFPDEPLRAVGYRTAEMGSSRLSVGGA